MKRKISILAILLGFCMTAFAQKQYINMVSFSSLDGNICWVRLNGDLPNNIKEEYDKTDDNTSIGELLNLLLDNGFSVEQMNTDVYKNSSGHSRILQTFLLSNSPVQKRYINVVSFLSDASDWDAGLEIRLTGDLPSNIKEKYLVSDISVGEVLNKLADEGFTVEQTNTLYSNDKGGSPNILQTFLLSNFIQNEVERITLNDGATEVARYNLQGIPVNENEKGVQIIVYSNYTTKTVVVQ